MTVDPEKIQECLANTFEAYMIPANQLFYGNEHRMAKVWARICVQHLAAGGLIPDRENPRGAANLERCGDPANRDASPEQGD
jgi:hypothetical protein